MDNSFLKGLLFFAAGYCTASYLLTGKLFGSVTKTTDTTEAGIAANVNKVVNNVKSWLKTNFPELNESEAIGFAKEATGVKTSPTDASVDDMVDDGTEPAYGGTDAGSGSIGAIFLTNQPLNPNRGYFQQQDITSEAPDAWDMRYANGENPNQRSLESDFRWSFN